MLKAWDTWVSFAIWAKASSFPQKNDTITMSITAQTDLRTPFYYYDLELLGQTISAIKTATQNKTGYHVHYALKACTTPAVLQKIAAHNLGADCVSGGEIQAAVENGFAPESIVFAGVGKADWEIELALQLGIACFNVESLPELENINHIAKRMGKVAPVAFRINPNVDAHTHQKITTGLNENKFGIAMSDMLPTIRLAQSMDNVAFQGLHFHIGSQITHMDAFERLAQRINELQTQLDTEGIVCRSINVGGGLGIDYQNPDTNAIPDFENYFNTFHQHLQLREGQELHFELGRSVVAQCGNLVTRVLYVKQGHEKQFVIVDAGMTDLIRPAMYDAYHQADNISSTSEKHEKYDIVGPICESSDVFLRDYRLPTTQRGDLIVFRSAGAYGEVMASQYNCRTLPASIAE